MVKPNWEKICKSCWCKEELGVCENFCRKVNLTLWRENNGR